MKIKETRLIYQEWYETELSKTGWDTHGWRFDDGTYYPLENGWDMVEHLRFDKFGNPILALVEKETEY